MSTLKLPVYLCKPYLDVVTVDVEVVMVAVKSLIIGALLDLFNIAGLSMSIFTGGVVIL